MIKLSNFKSPNCLVELDQYLKHTTAKKNGPITGHAFRLNHCAPLAVVDIDMKDVSDTASFTQLDSVIVKTCNNGFHVYCLDDGSLQEKKNRYVKYYETKHFTVDIFTSQEFDKESLVVAPDSKVKTRTGSIEEYKFIKGDWNSPITLTLSDALAQLDIHHSQQQKETPPAEVQPNPQPQPQPIIVDDVQFPYHFVPNYQLQVFVIESLQQLKGIKVHNDASGVSWKDELTIWHLFIGLRHFDKRLYQKGQEVIQNLDLTKNALLNFNRQWRKSGEHSQQEFGSQYTLLRIIAYYRPDYYHKYIESKIMDDLNDDVSGPVAMSQRATLDPMSLPSIDFHSDFKFSQVISKASNNEYQSYEEVIIDLAQFIRRLATASPRNAYIMKSTYINMIDELTSENRYHLEFMSASEVSQILDLIKIQINKKSKATAWTLLKENLDLFTIEGINYLPTFDPAQVEELKSRGILSLYTRYNYMAVDHGGVSRPYFDLIHDVIADGDELIYEYIVNWIAFILQKPRQKPCTALVITGPQGCGKTTFTDILTRELLKGYSMPNAKGLDSVLGRFNNGIDNKKLIVLDELPSISTKSTKALFNKFKSLITEMSTEVEEKGKQSRQAGNICSFIVLSNNYNPIVVDEDDRRWLCTRSSNVHCRDRAYWTQFYGSLTNEFYEDLMYRLLNHNISTFDPTVIPNTRYKANLKEANSDIYDEFIATIAHSLSEGNGMITRNIKAAFNDYKRSNPSSRFQYYDLLTKLRSICTEQAHKQIAGVRGCWLKLKPEYTSRYIHDDEQDDDIAEPQPKEVSIHEETSESGITEQSLQTQSSEHDIDLHNMYQFI